MKYKNILFDLDGTLTDSALGITKSVEYALNHFEIKVEDLSELHNFIGPPLVDSFMEYYGFSEEQANHAVDKYRERFSTIGMFENIVYDGIPSMLEELKSQGKNLIVATSKPTIFTLEILKHFNLYDYFTVICGSNLDGTCSKKSDIIKNALVESNIKDLSETIMVGDREHDIIGAQENKLQSIGVLYGYGSLEELKTAEATFIAKDVEELKAALSN